MSRSTRILTAAMVLAGLIGILPVSAQTTGTVTSADGPVGGATVFVSGTTVATETGDDGSFTLPESDLAWYDIAAWHADAGFGVVRFDPSAAEGSVTIMLEPSDEPAPTSAPSDDDMQYFRDVAFAWTGNSKDIEITNPDVLAIRREPDALEISAAASAPLKLVNPELGYEIVIHRFTLDGSPTGVDWSGYPLFIEMEAGGRRERRRFRRGRERAFEGSPRHFIHALAEGRMKEEDFEAYHVRGPGDPSRQNPVAEMEETGLGMGQIDPIYREGTHAGTGDLIFQGWLRVTYIGSNVENRYVRYVDRFYPSSDVKDVILAASKPKTVRDADRLAGQGMGNQAQQAENPRSVGDTWIILPYGSVTVDPMGSVLPQEGGGGIQNVGYWSFLRLAELLPYDYVPED
jgi:hypothetical protein